MKFNRIGRYIKCRPHSKRKLSRMENSKMFESLNINRYAKGLLRTHFKRLKEQTKNDTFNSAVQTQYLIMGIAMGWNSTNQITDEQEYFIRRLTDRILIRKYFPETLNKR